MWVLTQQPKTQKNNNTKPSQIRSLLFSETKCSAPSPHCVPITVLLINQPTMAAARLAGTAAACAFAGVLLGRQKCYSAGGLCAPHTALLACDSSCAASPHPSLPCAPFMQLPSSSLRVCQWTSWRVTATSRRPAHPLCWLAVAASTRPLSHTCECLTWLQPPWQR